MGTAIIVIFCCGAAWTLLNESIEKVANLRKLKLSEIEEAKKQLAEKEEWIEKLRDGVIQMAKERQIGFPWLANAYDELFKLEEDLATYELKNKKRPALKAAEAVREQSELRRRALRENKIAKSIIEYYEHVAPHLQELREEVEDPTEEDRKYSEGYSEEERQDQSTRFLTKEEYFKLPSCQKNQLALDRYWKRPKSKVEIGRIYERYIGYLFETDGYDVDFFGINQGKEDLGRDLICTKGNDVAVIQCKYWADFRTIYEKHIFQFFGTVFQIRDQYPQKNVHAVFYTSTQLSPLARRFASELNIQLEEGLKFNPEYPAIKCNISKDGTRIYHLPFDQQYDRVKIESVKGEFYAQTIQKAEEGGFRRAFRYSIGDQR